MPRGFLFLGIAASAFRTAAKSAGNRGDARMRKATDPPTVAPRIDAEAVRRRRGRGRHCGADGPVAVIDGSPHFPWREAPAAPGLLGEVERHGNQIVTRGFHRIESPGHHRHRDQGIEFRVGRGATGHRHIHYFAARGDGEPQGDLAGESGPHFQPRIIDVPEPGSFSAGLRALGLFAFPPSGPGSGSGWTLAVRRFRIDPW